MELLTRQEVAKLLRVSQSTVIRYESRGVLKPVKLPETRTVLYDKADIKKLISESKKQTKSNDV